MIYVDTSVVLAQLLSEDRVPPTMLWARTLVASRLLEYDLWNRLNARRLTASHGAAARQLLQRVAMLELLPMVLARALEPFPVPVRSLDGLHLASIEYLRTARQEVQLATYDVRMAEAARAMGIPLFEL